MQLQLFSKDPLDVVNAHKALVEMETRPLLDKIELDKPMVDFAVHVSKSCDNIMMREMAKLLNDEHVDIGEKRLYKLLRDKNVLMKNNEPYQTYINRKYFTVKEETYKTPYGDRLTRRTLVTPAGQIWLVGKVKEWITTQKLEDNTDEF